MNPNILSLVADIQKQRPGWRFSLLGGDYSFDYKRNKSDKIVGVDKKKPKLFFGWQAEFFGHEDPSKCTGQRHVSSSYYRTPNEAIIIACAKATKAIKEGVE